MMNMNMNMNMHMNNRRHARTHTRVPRACTHLCDRLLSVKVLASAAFLFFVNVTSRQGATAETESCWRSGSGSATHTRRHVESMDAASAEHVWDGWCHATAGLRLDATHDAEPVWHAAHDAGHADASRFSSSRAMQGAPPLGGMMGHHPSMPCQAQPPQEPPDLVVDLAVAAPGPHAFLSSHQFRTMTVD